MSTRNVGSSIRVMPTSPASAPRSSPLALTVLALLHYQPLHPYGIQRLIKQWGKDQVVNVEQRTSLYRTIERLLGGGPDHGARDRARPAISRTDGLRAHRRRPPDGAALAGGDARRAQAGVPRVPGRPVPRAHAGSRRARGGTGPARAQADRDAGRAGRERGRRSRARAAQDRHAGNRVPARCAGGRGPVGDGDHRRAALGEAGLVPGRAAGLRRGE